MTVTVGSSPTGARWLLGHAQRACPHHPPGDVAEPRAPPPGPVAVLKNASAKARDHHDQVLKATRHLVPYRLVMPPIIRRSCRAWAISLPALSHREASSTLQFPAVDEFRCEPRTGAAPGAVPRSAHRCTVSSTVGAGTGDVSSGNTPGARSLKRRAAPGPITTSGMTDSQASMYGSVAAVSGEQPPHRRMARWQASGRNDTVTSDGGSRA